jgi:hypothetical protein
LVTIVPTVRLVVKEVVGDHPTDGRMVDPVSVVRDGAPVDRVVASDPVGIVRDIGSSVVMKAVGPELDVAVSRRRRLAGADHQDPRVSRMVDDIADDLDVVRVLDSYAVSPAGGDVEAADSDSSVAVHPDRRCLFPLDAREHHVLARVRPERDGIRWVAVPPAPDELARVRPGADDDDAAIDGDAVEGVLDRTPGASLRPGVRIVAVRAVDVEDSAVRRRHPGGKRRAQARLVRRLDRR